MLHAKLFLTKESYRDAFFSTTKLDRPLVAQFCANDPELLLEAAKLLCSKAEIDAVDINFGVNQKIKFISKSVLKELQKKDFTVHF
jgi:tRNA-dihydrouridine synthase 1